MKTRTTPKATKATGTPKAPKRVFQKWSADKDSFILEEISKAEHNGRTKYDVCKELGGLFGCSRKSVEMRLKEINLRIERAKHDATVKNLQGQLTRINRDRNDERQGRARLKKIPILTALFGLYSLKKS